jgi:hypothetical protein
MRDIAMRDMLDGFRDLILFASALIVLFVGWAVAGGFTLLDMMVIAAVSVHYVLTFKLGKNKYSTVSNVRVDKSHGVNDDAPIKIRR